MATLKKHCVSLTRTGIWVAFADTVTYDHGSFSFLQKRHKSCNKRPKKKIYHRVPELDRVMELQKKPSLILHLKDIVFKQKKHCILLRDLEKEVGVIQKWNFMSIIERYPSIFRVHGGNRRPHVLELTDKVLTLAKDEEKVRENMEPIVVKNLRKLLMMSMDCRVALDKINLIRLELGLPENYVSGIILKYPEFFKLDEINGRDYVLLERWDPDLAVTAREASSKGDNSLVSGHGKKVPVSKDGNFLGPFSFKLDFPLGFRPNMKYLEEVQKWQKLAFPSPYLNARQFDPASSAARKRAVAVLHELLSLTLEKRLTSAQLDVFHAEYQLPCRLLLCLVRQHGIFYMTNKGVRSTVFLKEAYRGSRLIEKSPILIFNDRFLELMGRREVNLDSGVPLFHMDA
ncbi:protein ROOT PRIMORDIUM DEFECTIVE 1 isoform X1 [Amborella trichopoda]|uniref:PORR domain-containing protein n=1 Tax=Amborella trichopoda TaxID=13333 RepID=U5CNT3_AMBTC|nr:protein ROOT PRIMORDIUM DEFECTIVE 1 isoform X1 [Amborella trichopoda]ERN14816.1 hypothetical protein AMTR_s00032p00102420 [Amborella trichopoda]|eukprot:XP_020528525.1 protein ROOT PRIMORDIUM DEFECTIVE 1 isoform X1 [Amborella trichopoda]